MLDRVAFYPSDVLNGKIRLQSGSTLLESSCGRGTCSSDFSLKIALSAPRHILCENASSILDS